MSTDAEESIEATDDMDEVLRMTVVMLSATIEEFRKRDVGSPGSDSEGTAVARIASLLTAVVRFKMSETAVVTTMTVW